MRIKKKSGTFPDGAAEYDPKGEFKIRFDSNKSTIVEAMLDNTPTEGGVRFIDQLTVGDTLKLVMLNSSGVENCLFYGLIQSLEFEGNTHLVQINAIDTTTYGENVFMNTVLYQKFNSNVEFSLNKHIGATAIVGVDNSYTELPTDTTVYAPIVAETRQCYGKHLQNEFDNLWMHRGQLVYTAPEPSGFVLRGVGGLGRLSTGDGSEDDPWVDFPEDVNPLSTVERPVLGSGNYYSADEFYFSNGAKKVVAQTFEATRDDQITNIFFPIAKCIRRYPSQITASRGKDEHGNNIASGTNVIADDGWDQTSALSPGNYGWHEIVGCPQETRLHDTARGQPYNTFGPGLDLKVTLVKCTQSESAQSGSTVSSGGATTKYDTHVNKKEMVPSAVSLGQLGGTPEAGIDWTNLDDLSYAAVEVMKDSDGNPIQITIEPENPVPSPHYPAGETIATNYMLMNHNTNYPDNKRGHGHEVFMHDENYADAYTLFGWNLESTPVNIERGETYALVFEMLGNPNHPQETDGTDIGGTPNPGYLSPAIAWAVGIAIANDALINHISGVTNTAWTIYDEGAHLKSALNENTNSDGTGNMVGHHGRVTYSSQIRSLPGYDITYGQGSPPTWQHTPSSRAGPYISGAEFGFWEYEDWLSTQAARDLNYNVMVSDKGGSAAGSVEMPTMFPVCGFRGKGSHISSYFSVVSGAWKVAGENLYWKWDAQRRLVLWGAGSADYQPVTDIGNIKMSRISYYSNPSTGGLLRASNKSTVRDVFHSLCSRVSEWGTVVCDYTLDGADDVYGTGYNDSSTFELSYFSSTNETVWKSIVKLAQQYDAKVWIHTDLSGNNTLVFEKMTTITDFAYNNPGIHQYSFSNRTEDPDILKYMTYTKISQDIENMYTRFRIIGASPDEASGTYTIPGLPTANTSSPPISWILDVPQMQTLTGYRKEFEFKSEKNITSFELAKKAAEALKTIYAQDQYSGTLTLSGCHPLYENASLGLMFDRNAVVRIMDKYAVTGDSPTGTTNVFRVTGIEYESREHKTSLQLTTIIENTDYVEAQRTINQLKKNEQKEQDIGNRYTEKCDAPSPLALSTTMMMYVRDSTGRIIAGEDKSPTVVDGDGEWFLVGSFLAGYGTIANDAQPIIQVESEEITTPATSYISALENSIYKWEKDSLTVIQRFVKP